MRDRRVPIYWTYGPRARCRRPRIRRTRTRRSAQMGFVYFRVEVLPMGNCEGARSERRWALVDSRRTTIAVRPPSSFRSPISYHYRLRGSPKVLRACVRTPSFRRTHFQHWNNSTATALGAGRSCRSDFPAGPAFRPSYFAALILFSFFRMCTYTYFLFIFYRRTVSREARRTDAERIPSRCVDAARIHSGSILF